MAWLEIHQSLPKHPKTLRACALLKMDKHKFIGHLVSMWLWALDYADADGNLPDSVGERVIATGAEVTREKAAGWCAALLQAGGGGRAGFLERVDDHFLIHDWFDFAGRLIVRREANRDRMRAARALHVHNTLHARAPATVHNSTQHNSTQPVPPVVPQGDTATQDKKTGLDIETKEKNQDQVSVSINGFEIGKVDAAWWHEFTSDFADVLNETEMKKFRDYWFTGKRRLKNLQLALRHWMERAHLGISGSSVASDGLGLKEDPDKYVKGKYGHMVQR